MKLSKDPSLAAIIIETLRRHVPSRFYMWLDDLHRLTDDCVEVILHECPFLARPEDDDGLSIIREDRHNPKLQLTLQKKVIPEYNLVFATNSNPPKQTQQCHSSSAPWQIPHDIHINKRLCNHIQNPHQWIRTPKLHWWYFPFGYLSSQTPSTKHKTLLIRQLLREMELNYPLQSIRAILVLPHTCQDLHHCIHLTQSLPTKAW